MTNQSKLYGGSAKKKSSISGDPTSRQYAEIECAFYKGSVSSIANNAPAKSPGRIVEACGKTYYVHSSTIED